MDFTFSSDSPNLRQIEKQSKLQKIALRILPEMGHRVIPIESTWYDFEASRSRKFLKELQRIGRNLHKQGPWKIIYADGKEQSDIIRKTMDVEERSWKHKWRHGEEDSLLKMVLTASQQLERTVSGFRWSVNFLELGNRAIAYVLVVEYMGVSYLVKTSYDENYKRFYPGILVQNSAIHEQFQKGKNRQIDFLSDLSYLQAWTDKCIPPG